MRNLAMPAPLLNLLAALRSALRTRAELALENLALRQQSATWRSFSVTAYDRRFESPALNEPTWARGASPPDPPCGPIVSGNPSERSARSPG